MTISGTALTIICYYRLQIFREEQLDNVMQFAEIGTSVEKHVEYQRYEIM